MGVRCAFLSLTITVSLAAACGSDEPPDLDEIASMSEDDAAEMAREMKDLSGVAACELLTASEIEAATGIAPGEPQDMSQVQGQLPMCTWPAADGSGRNVASILVTRGGLENGMVQVDAETAEGKDELEASKDLALNVFGRL